VQYGRRLVSRGRSGKNSARRSQLAGWVEALGCVRTCPARARRDSAELRRVRWSKTARHTVAQFSGDLRERLNEAVEMDATSRHEGSASWKSKELQAWVKQHR